MDERDEKSVDEEIAGEVAEKIAEGMVGSDSTAGMAVEGEEIAPAEKESEVEILQKQIQTLQGTVATLSEELLASQGGVGENPSLQENPSLPEPDSLSIGQPPESPGLDIPDLVGNANLDDLFEDKNHLNKILWQAAQMAAKKMKDEIRLDIGQELPGLAYNQVMTAQKNAENRAKFFEDHPDLKEAAPYVSVIAQRLAAKEPESLNDLAAFSKRVAEATRLSLGLHKKAMNSPGKNFSERATASGRKPATSKISAQAAQIKKFRESLGM